MNGDNEFEFYGYSQMMPYKGCIFVYNNSSVQLIADFTSPETANIGEEIHQQEIQQLGNGILKTME